ncbi:MAG: SDR family NAD(P)-dependent oxidoreductase [Pseudomonadota bacterium]
MQNLILVGAGPGVGEAIAWRFGRAGFRIGLIARNSARLSELAARLKAASIPAFWSTADAADMGQIDQALDALVGEMGPCNVMIYNAAVLRPEDPLDLETETLAQEFAVNVLGAHRVAKKLAGPMVTRGSGAMLFTNGGLAYEPFPEWTSLALGKAALRSLSISLYKELSPKGVHVASIAICGIVREGGPFDPARIAEFYYQAATSPKGIEDREIVIQPPGTDWLYNDPQRTHSATTRAPKYP